MNFALILEGIRKNLIVVLSVTLALSAAIVYVLHMDRRADLDSEIEQLEIRISTMLKNLKNSVGLEEDITRLGEQIDQFDERLFDFQELATNYNYFFDIEKRTGVKLSGLRQLEVTQEELNGIAKKKRMPKPTEDVYSKVRYHMKADGDFGQLVGLMRELEGGPSFYRLEKFRLSKSGGSALSMDISLLILGRKQS
jgi:hypothetical protein